MTTTLVVPFPNFRQFSRESRWILFGGSGGVSFLFFFLFSKSGNNEGTTQIGVPDRSDLECAAVAIDERRKSATWRPE